MQASALRQLQAGTTQSQQTVRSGASLKPVPTARVFRQSSSRVAFRGEHHPMRRGLLGRRDRARLADMHQQDNGYVMCVTFDAAITWESIGSDKIRSVACCLTVQRRDRAPMAVGTTCSIIDRHM